MGLLVPTQSENTNNTPAMLWIKNRLTICLNWMLGNPPGAIALKDGAFRLDSSTNRSPFCSKQHNLLFLYVTGIFFRLLRQGSSWSRKIKSSAVIAALVLAAVLAGHTVLGQVIPQAPSQPLGSLKRERIPEPDNIRDFIQDKTAAITLGKTLFWDMQVGSDGIQSCASCHFHAGVDNRTKNQINPGFLPVKADGTPNPDKVFNIADHPTYQLTAGDYPIQTNDVITQCDRLQH